MSISPDIQYYLVTPFLWHARGQNFCANFVPLAYKNRPYLGIPSNMAGYCKLMAQNWHKNLPHTDHKNGVTK